MKQKNIDLHNRCQCEIRYRPFRSKPVPTPGLFCQQHDVFLDWLSQDIATELISEGVTVAPYIERKKSKTKSAKSKFYKLAKYYHRKAKKQKHLTT